MQYGLGMAEEDPFAREVEAAVALLESLADDYERLADVAYPLRQRLVVAAGRVARPGPWAKRALRQEAERRRAAERRARDEAKLAATGIRQSRRARLFTPWQHGAVTSYADHGAQTKPNLVQAATPPHPELPTDEGDALSEPVHCYICKAKYRRLHFFYDALCPRCADLNWRKRTPVADLSRRVALVTGARVKIGFFAALMLLRAGARVVVTTRFPHDAARRYARQNDYAAWADRLEIVGLDLRHTPSVERFCTFLGGRLSRLDFILNNACQTVRRPAGFYDHLLEAERAPGDGCAAPLDAHRSFSRGPEAALTESAAMSQLPLLNADQGRDLTLFPRGQLDADEQQVDLREINSWRLGLADVSSVELLETQLVNAIAPFILNSRLKAVMLR
ncbi:MAG: SDR family NAD(P)-dependent oxidoreductase, partial [Myxococcota bacterium]